MRQKLDRFNQNQIRDVVYRFRYEITNKFVERGEGVGGRFRKESLILGFLLGGPRCMYGLV